MGRPPGAAAATHPDLAAEDATALRALTSLVVHVIDRARLAGDLDTAVVPPRAAGVLVAVLDGLTLHGVAGSQPPEALTATLDAAVDLVLLTG